MAAPRRRRPALPAADRPLPHLGGLSARRFLAEHWQKKPLFVRGAFPGFAGVLTPDELAGLACVEEAQARLVRHHRGRWHLETGPFDEARFRSLPARGWSLLVQGVNHFEPAGERLLAAFDFVPHARLDDLMVSYAPPGGSVGPHFDSYDVFLVQARGRRRWQISGQRDMALVAGAPLRILERFLPEEEWICGPGDLLYLPPRYAHHGVALDECMTCSVGFRAPSARELCDRFLAWLPEHIAPAGQAMYADPDLQPAAHPAAIGDAMVDQVATMLRAVTWDREAVGDFLGCYLSEPKPHIVFRRPRRPLSEPALAEAVRRRGVRLAPESLLLCRGDRFFLNGEPVAPPPSAPSVRAALLALGDGRSLAPSTRWSAALLKHIDEWYRAGWVLPGGEPGGR